MQWPSGLESEHAGPPGFTFTTDSSRRTEGGDICKDFELPLFTAAHFACGRNEAFRRDPIGINKYTKHASPQDTGEQFYLCTTAGIFTKGCWDGEPFPGSISRLAYCSCSFLSFSVISVHRSRSGRIIFKEKRKIPDHVTESL